MSESDEYPKFKVVYDSYYKAYMVKRKDHQLDNWRGSAFDSYMFKWMAIRRANKLIESNRWLNKRTETDVWGPYP